MKPRNSLHAEKEPVPEWKLARGSWGMLPREILKLRSSEIAENVYFTSCFCIFKAFKEGNQVNEKGHFARAFEKWRWVRAMPMFVHYSVSYYMQWRIQAKI